ncbi:beta-N-acetylhexosaminidase [Acidobacteria bacterium AH-259-L09]|nr:beta-N-acetylhexosaminidase [Acidobacteria bacterium AH-259-L09]
MESQWDRRVGTFFVVGFDGISMPSSLKRLCERRGLGGVILFDRNIESPGQLKRLTGQLQSLSANGPLIISIDQEGGGFQRLKPPHFTAFPPACEVGIQTALDLGRRMGQELAELGINVDLAPVLDVNTNPHNPIIDERSFGSDPQLVAEVGRLFVKGLQEKGVLACGKHFPGHGDTDQDSHLTLPVVDHPIGRLRTVELVPFYELIEARLIAVMTAHVLYPALDSTLPATFSEMILSGLLRKELGFEGLIITDDMGMAGSLSQADLSEACIQAFAAGCDLLLVCEHHQRHEEIIEALGKAIDRSNALQKRARESLERLRGVTGGW